MKIFFFLSSPKNLAKTNQNPFFYRSSAVERFDLFDCPGFLSKKYGKSNYNILKNCHYLSLFKLKNGHYLSLLYIQQSFFIHFFIQRLDSLKKAKC